MADGADAVLFAQHLLVALCVDARSFPFALLGVMRMAKVFGVKVVIATVYYANARRLLAVGVSGVAVAQETLVMRFAQPLGFNWLNAAFFNTLRRLVHNTRAYFT